MFCLSKNLDEFLRTKRKKRGKTHTHMHTHTHMKRKKERNEKRLCKVIKPREFLAVAVVKNLPWELRSHKACAPQLEKPTHYN